MLHNPGERRRWAWLLAGQSSVAAVYLCRFGWVWVLAGTSLVTICGIFWDRYLPEDGVAVTLQVKYGKVGTVLIGVTIIWHVIMLGWSANLADSAFPMVEGAPGLGWALLVLTAWGTVKGPTACAGCCGVLCLILLALYSVVLGFSLPDVKLEYLRPTGDWTQALWTIVICLSSGSLWYLSCGSKKQGGWKLGIILPVFSSMMCAVTAGVLSPELVREKQVPIYDLAQSVSLFGVVERIEPLLSAAITMGVFALLSSLSCACHALADQIFPWRWSGAAACVAAAIVMLFAEKIPVFLLAAGSLLVWFLFPLASVWPNRTRTRKSNYK